MFHFLKYNNIKLIYSDLEHVIDYESTHCMKLQNYINDKIKNNKKTIKCICKGVDVLLTTDNSITDSFIINDANDINIFFTTYMNKCMPYFYIIPHIIYFNKYLLNGSLFNPPIDQLYFISKCRLTDDEITYFNINKKLYLYFIKKTTNFYIDTINNISYIQNLIDLLKFYQDQQNQVIQDQEQQIIKIHDYINNLNTISNNIYDDDMPELLNPFLCTSPHRIGINMDANYSIP